MRHPAPDIDEAAAFEFVRSGACSLSDTGPLTLSRLRHCRAYIDGVNLGLRG